MHHARTAAHPREYYCEVVERAVYTDDMSETWITILGLLLFACFIWWITTGTGYFRRMATSSREPPSPRVKAIWWIAYAVTALWVLANSSCEGPDQLGQYEQRQPLQYAQAMLPGPGGVSESDRLRPTGPDGTRQGA
jgi:hypothetical protein